MYPNGMNVQPGYYQAPTYPYGQTQMPYVPTPTYQPVSQPTNQQRSRDILGHMITNPNEITPQEIPMDGSISLFPMQDGSAVYGKYWDNNGQLKTMRFIPENVEQPQQETDPVVAAMNERFDTLEKLIRDQRGRTYSQKNHTTPKGGQSNES